MRLAIFGSTGRTGTLITRQALGEGHQLKVLVRQPEKLGSIASQLTVVSGDIKDYSAVEAVVADSDVVMSTLSKWGQREDTLTRGIANITEAMRRHGVRRIVTLTGAGMLVPEDQFTFNNRLMNFVVRVAAPGVYQDAWQHYQILADSGLDWTVVRTPVMTKRPPRRNYRSGYLNMGLLDRVSYSDVADFMLKLATSNQYLRQAPIISY
jgi:putative NADH-flavin reductase